MEYEIHRGTIFKGVDAKSHLHALKKFLNVRKLTYLTKKDFRRRFGEGSEIEVLALYPDPAYAFVSLDRALYTYIVKKTKDDYYYALKHVGA